MLCSNAYRDRHHPLMVIRESNKPKGFKNIPLKHEKNYCMPSELFSDWFHNEFSPKITMFLESKGLPPKEILILANATSQPDIETLKNGDIITNFYLQT